MSEKSVFSKIIDRELPAEIVFENDHIIVIKDIQPDAPIHLLGITKKPYTNLDELLQEADGRDLLWELYSRLSQIAHDHGIDKTGYRLVTNIGEHAHQIVPHLHVHLLGGEKLQMHDPLPKG
jgi:histidine triad (HIT) family protein